MSRPSSHPYSNSINSLEKKYGPLRYEVNRLGYYNPFGVITENDITGFHLSYVPHLESYLKNPQSHRRSLVDCFIWSYVPGYEARYWGNIYHNQQDLTSEDLEIIRSLLPYHAIPEDPNVESDY